MAELAEKLRSLNLTVEQYEALTDETLTQEMISDLKYLGAESPPLVTAKAWAKRAVEKDMNPRQRRMIHLAAMGRSIGAIADELDYNYYTVRKMMADPEVKLRIAHKQELLYQHNVKDYVKTLMNKAYGTIDEILSDDTGEVKHSVKLAAAQYVIDHTAGKASQTLEVKGNLLGDLISQLDQLKNVTGTTQDVLEITATPAEPSYVDEPVDEVEVESKTVLAKANLEPLVDEMDALVDKLVPDEFTVGKRS